MYNKIGIKNDKEALYEIITESSFSFITTKKHIDYNILISDIMCYKSLYYLGSALPTNKVINILYKDGNH